eukprot:TRINITY_DN18743_c0_g1_i1.p1 TRINITY_DN18743_c0_g1~~TRINITY_DN18743_c0_g1_i1.p1  ORF type:complete len:416 (-),score=82.78 TRINITY_DN18743_c0_g1_i1:125-1372(-)
MRADVAGALSGVCPVYSRDVEELLIAAFDAWELDTLALAEATGNRPLSSLGMFLFSKLGFMETLQLDSQKVINFFVSIEDSLNDANSYHNRAHIASVMHCMHAILHHGCIREIAVAELITQSSATADVTDADCSLGIMTCLIAAALHDYEHLGLSNDFLVNTCHERALFYGGEHVNERHHAAAGLNLLCQPECNFLEALPRGTFGRICDIVADVIIATDMAKHKDIVAKLQNMLGNCQPEDGHGEDSRLLLQAALKCADLGHLAMPWDLHQRWVLNLEEEFFDQGDRERELGLSISFLMDRDKPGVSQSQQGFFDYVVLPLFTAFSDAAPAARPLLDGVLANHQRWQDLVTPDDKSPCHSSTSRRSTGTSCTTSDDKSPCPESISRISTSCSLPDAQIPDSVGNSVSGATSFSTN